MSDQKQLQENHEICQFPLKTLNLSKKDMEFVFYLFAELYARLLGFPGIIEPAFFEGNELTGNLDPKIFATYTRVLKIIETEALSEKLQFKEKLEKEFISPKKEQEVQPEKTFNLTLNEYYMLATLLEEINTKLMKEKEDEKIKIVHFLTCKFCFDEKLSDVETFRSLLVKLFDAQDVSEKKLKMIDKKKPNKDMKKKGAVS